jgi:excisionase family DNA binding protein
MDGSRIQYWQPSLQRKYMKERSQSESHDDYCGTSYASNLLNLSVGTIQALVEKKKLVAWKTQGGHRRISLASIRKYQLQHNLPSTPSIASLRSMLRVLIIDDDEPTRLMLKASFEQWGMAVDALLYESAVDALLDLTSWKPHIILTDLRMPHMNGFEFLKSLSKHELYREIAVVAMSGLSHDEILVAGGLPDGVQYMRKPVDMEWLRGFFDAVLILQQINQRPL